MIDDWSGVLKSTYSIAFADLPFRVAYVVIVIRFYFVVRNFYKGVVAHDKQGFV
jgi:hypothetical protein